MKDIENKEIKLSGRSIEEIQSDFNKRVELIENCISGMDVWKVRINAAFAAGIIMFILVYFDQMFIYFAIIAFIVGSLEHFIYYSGLDKILKEESEKVYNESIEIEMIKNPELFNSDEEE